MQVPAHRYALKIVDYSRGIFYLSINLIDTHYTFINYFNYIGGNRMAYSVRTAHIIAIYHS